MTALQQHVFKNDCVLSFLQDQDEENDDPEEDDGTPLPPARGRRKKNLPEHKTPAAKPPHVTFDNFGPPGALTPPASNSPYHNGRWPGRGDEGGTLAQLPVRSINQMAPAQQPVRQRQPHGPI